MIFKKFWIDSAIEMNELAYQQYKEEIRKYAGGMGGEINTELPVEMREQGFS